MVAKKTNLYSDTPIYLLRALSPGYVLAAITLSLLLAGFTHRKHDDNLKKKLERRLTPIYAARLTDRHMVLADIKIVKLSILTEKTDSAFSRRIMDERIGLIKRDIENRLTQLNKYSIIIRQGRDLSSELFNEALQKSETETTELEPIIKSFTALTTRLDNLTRMLNSNQLDSLQATGHVVLFNVEARDSKHAPILLHSLQATFTLRNKIKRIQELDLEGIGHTLEKNRI